MLEDFRRELSKGKHLVARVAICGNCPVVAARVRTVVAAEAARKRIMAEMVRVSAPRDFHLWKDITRVEPNEDSPAFAG